MNCSLADLVEAYSRMIHGRDPNLAQHHERVGALCQQYAERILMSVEETELLVAAARIHDVGKLGVRLDIIDKVTLPTQSEFEAMRQHPGYGRGFMEPWNLDLRIVDVLLHHHENYDGTGYPGGLVGESIPEWPRIIRVPDSIDAIRYARAYKGDHQSPDVVIRRLRERAHWYDPRILPVFLEILNDKEAP